MEESISNTKKHLKDQFYDFCGCFSIDEIASNEELIPIVEKIERMLLSGYIQIPVETEFDRLFRVISFLERRRNPILARKKSEIQSTLLRLKNMLTQTPRKDERDGLYA